MQDLNLFDLVPDTAFITSYRVKVNEVFTNDNIVFGSQGFTNSYNFYTIDRVETLMANFNRQGQSYFIMYISLDQQINQYYRSTIEFSINKILKLDLFIFK